MTGAHDTARRILKLFDELGRDRLDLHAMFDLAGGNRPEDQRLVLEEVDRMVENGWLRAAQSDFFVRTELGRLVAADSREVILLTRKDCHLCETAKRDIQPVLAEFGAALREMDIDTEAVLHERYANDVPVIFAGGQEISRHKADLERLRQALRRSVSSR